MPFTHRYISLCEYRLLARPEPHRATLREAESNAQVSGRPNPSLSHALYSFSETELRNFLAESLRAHVARPALAARKVVSAKGGPPTGT
jgi:hypothetical protein